MIKQTEHVCKWLFFFPSFSLVRSITSLNEVVLHSSEAPAYWLSQKERDQERSKVGHSWFDCAIEGISIPVGAVTCCIGKPMKCFMILLCPAGVGSRRSDCDNTYR